MTSLESLTTREREVLELTATGVTNLETARQLRISVHAVKFHLAHVYQKLGVTNRVQASRILYSNGARHEGGVRVGGAL